MHRFIVPDLDGPITGGTLYNRNLIQALNSAGIPCQVLNFSEARSAVVEGTEPRRYWLDSLYLDALPNLARSLARGRSVGLIVHYLPSLVASALGPPTQMETATLLHASAFVVPSAFMHGQVNHLRPTLLVEPGRLAQGPATLPPPPVRAVMVANLLPGKGIEPFLRQLAALRPRDAAFHLGIIGGANLDPEYARHCRRVVDQHDLSDAIAFEGALPPDQTLRRLHACNLLLSSSLMESYGMALSEARTLGIPILAQQGGNVSTLVNPESGGQVLSNAKELAEAFVTICRDPDVHRARMCQARLHALPPRAWAQAAQEFVAQTALLHSSDATTPSRAVPP